MSLKQGDTVGAQQSITSKNNNQKKACGWRVKVHLLCCLASFLFTTIKMMLVYST